MVAFDDGLIVADCHRFVAFCGEDCLGEKFFGGFRAEQHRGRLLVIGQHQFLDGAGAGRMRKQTRRSAVGPECDP